MFSKQSRNFLEASLIICKLNNALHCISNNRASGPDRLLAAFYKVYRETTLLMILEALIMSLA